MSRMRQHLFDRDLRYVIKPRYAARASALGSHSHWIVSILIAVAVAIWLGRAPDASIDRVQPDADDTAVLKAQIASVLVAEPPISKAPTTSVQTLPPPAGMQGLAALSIPAKQTIHATETVPAGPSTPAVGDTARVALAPPRDSLTAMIPAAPAPHWQTVEIRKGDSLTRVFKQLGLDPRPAIIIANKPGARALKNLRIGPHLKVRISDDKLVALQYQQNLTTLLRVEATGGDYSIDTVKRQFDITEREVTGLITDSLYRSALRAGLSDQFTYSLASIFQWQIDFATDIRKGDRFSVVFEEKSLDGKKAGKGAILAAEFVVSGNHYRAVRQASKDGTSAYFAPDGTSLRGVFLRSPVAITRITSGYSLKRFHPVLKKWRAHRGVDYAGRTGTPVMATGAGKVIFAGRKGGYGKAVILKHGGRYSTLYGHLSRYGKGIRKGQRVNQGQVIGYIGSTGLATGPHLHYEFRVNGKHRNPLTVRTPRAAPVNAAEKTAFLKHATTWTKRLNQLTGA